MTFKKIVKVVAVGCSIVALGACSTTKHRAGMNDDMSGSAGGDSVQSSGVGQSDGFGGQGGAVGPRASLSKRTYYFDYDKDVVHESDKPAIYGNADYLVAHPRTHITLEGHTDPRGSREYNVALGERRANAVLELLKSRGVNPGQVRVVSYGAERLAVPGRTESDYQLDRRVVLVYAQN